MPDTDGVDPQRDDCVSPPRVGWTTCIAVVVFYIGCVGAATYPFFRTFRTRIVPSLIDPLQHLWVMRWYKTCLLEGRLPVYCPEIHYPVGAPLGYFSPLQLQALLYIPLSFFFDDVLCYNLIWLIGMVFTGFGTFLLIWQFVPHRASACFGGMLAMLSGPMLAHGRVHLEIIHLGAFPLFMVAWMRFVDQPTRKRLGAATALYVLLALSAAYYVVFAIVPAALYVAWQALRALRTKDAAWLRGRLGWLGAFVAMSVPTLSVVFGSQLWAQVQGFPTSRGKSAFDSFGTSLWTYVIPSPAHRLSALLPCDPYAITGFRWTADERTSYLGVVTLALIYYAAVSRVRFVRARYWWSMFALFVVLSCGAYWQLWSLRVSLPADWLKRWFFAFGPIRVPARYNLFAAVAAALLAAAGLRHLLQRIPGRYARMSLYCVLAALAVMDLSTTPFKGLPVPRVPACYRWIQEHEPDAPLLEIPQYASGGSFLYAVTSYWQSHHRATTNVAYSGQANLRLDNLLTWQSPFQAESLRDPNYLKVTYPAAFGITTKAAFSDYAWLYMKAHKFRYIVLHLWPHPGADFPIHIDRLKEVLAPYKVYEDNGNIVYSVDKLPPPTHPIVLCTNGWRLGWYTKRLRVSERTSEVAVYTPESTMSLRLGIEAKAFRRAQTVRLKEGGRELAQFALDAERLQIVQSTPFRLPAGLHTLTLECDAPVIQPEPNEYAVGWDPAPFSLYVGGICLNGDESAAGPEVPAIAERNRTTQQK